MPNAFGNVLRAVAECLADLETQPTGACFDDRAINTVAPASVELDTEQAELASGAEGILERVAWQDATAKD